MLRFSQADLVYIGQGKNSKGSPKELEHIVKGVKVTETKTFSLNYYNTNGTLQRSMRKSKNIVIPLHLSEDKIINGVRYELLYVDYQCLRYRVHNILHYRRNGLRVLLDIEELRWFIHKAKFMSI